MCVCACVCACEILPSVLQCPSSFQPSLFCFSRLQRSPICLPICPDPRGPFVTSSKGLQEGEFSISGTMQTAPLQLETTAKST